MRYQEAIKKWMEATFGWAPVYTHNLDSAYHQKTGVFRFLEEAIELCQAEGLTYHDIDNVVCYVMNRPIGKLEQEVGGVMVTLAAYCNSKRIDLEIEMWREFYRIDTEEMREKIRRKQDTKPNGLPMPKSVRAVCNLCHETGLSFMEIGHKLTCPLR